MFDLEMIKPVIDDVLYVLKSSKAGSEVDNGYGVEFDIKEYAVVARRQLDQFDDDTVMCLVVEESESIVGQTLNRLYEDAYTVIYKNENYKYPEKAKVQIDRCGTNVNVTVDRLYRLAIKFDDIKKYCADRVNITELTTQDLFYQLFDSSSLSDILATGGGFVADNTTIDFVQVTGDELIFKFHCRNNTHYQCKPIDYSHHKVTQKESDTVQLKFENSNLSIDLIDKLIRDLIKS